MFWKRGLEYDKGRYKKEICGVESWAAALLFASASFLW